jgi:hypothetical protein
VEITTATAMVMANNHVTHDYTRKLLRFNAVLDRSSVAGARLDVSTGQEGNVRLSGSGQLKPGSSQSAFRAQRWQFVLLGKDVRIQICDPEFALLGHAQVVERVGNVRSHDGPEEFRICGPELR